MRRWIGTVLVVVVGSGLLFGAAATNAAVGDGIASGRPFDVT